MRTRRLKRNESRVCLMRTRRLIMRGIKSLLNESKEI